jgi:ribosomal protein S18 acetylase RimI-like enzyme
VGDAGPRIRPARAEDAAEVARWFPDRRTAVLWAGPHVPDPLSPLWLAREFDSRARAHFVAVEDGGRDGGQAEELPLGVIGMRRRTGERRVHLIRIGVAPERRGEGLAARLIDAMAALARAGGARRLTLNVYGANTSAVRAYEKAGFRLAELTPGLADSEGRVLRMSRDV